MAQRRLADFILENIEPILSAWEEFARSIEPPALTMNDEELRDHAQQMLLAFATDLNTPQSEEERAAKARGLGKRGSGDTAAEIHATERLKSGYTVVQLVSEYRALRASVLTLWKPDAEENAANITDVTRFNEAVDQAVAESVARYAQLVRQSQNMFLAILGHDLRNPLGTVVIGSSLLMQALDVPAKYVLVATRMFSSGKRMGKLINDLIDFTRTHLGPGIPIRSRKDNLATVCKEVVNELRTFHPERRVELRVQPVLDAVFDDGRIAQMLSNLIGNALQYGDPNTPVKVSVRCAGENVSIMVRNHGPVIPPEKMSGIFDPMVRLATCGRSEASEHSSLGIGLFIAREIAQAHGGTITVASSAAAGTVFTATMPLLQPAPRTDQRSAAA